MDTKELKEFSIALMDAVKQRGVSVFEVKTADFKLHIEMPGAAPETAVSVAAAAATIPTVAEAPQE